MKKSFKYKDDFYGTFTNIITDTISFYGNYYITYKIDLPHQ